MKAAARERLLALVDPALGALSELVRQKKGPHVRLGAARDILDRAGLAAHSRVKVTADVTTDGGAAWLRYLPADRLEVLVGWIGEAEQARCAEEKK